MESRDSDTVVCKESSAIDNNEHNLHSTQFEAKSKSELKEEIEVEDRRLTDAFLANFLSANSNVTVDCKVEKTNETDFQNDIKTTSVLCTQVDDSPKDSSIEEKSTPERFSHVLLNNSSVPAGDTCVDDNTNSQVSELSSTKTLVEPKSNGYRCLEEAWSADEDSSSYSSGSSSDSDAFLEIMREGPAPKKLIPVKTKGELELDDLPPIEDLVISVTEQEMEKIGKIYAIVEKLVVIRALKDMRPLDLDSVLFLSHDTPLGRIFDVFGPVIEPFYSIRFNSINHINEKGVQVDADVFFAPQKNDITSYVFVDDLKNQKGSDASWKDNNEPPEECLDYSDDEQERVARRKRMIKNRNQSVNNSDHNNSHTKKPLLDGDSPTKPSYIPPPRPAPRRNAPTSTFFRPNPFSTPRPLITSTPPLHIVPSAPSPFSISQTNQHHISYAVQSPQIALPYQQANLIQRHSGPPLVFATYQQPVFGQVAMLGPMSPAIHTAQAFQSSVLTSVPALIPATHHSPQNYFAQRFSRSPSPAPMSPDPWLPNRAPYQQSNLPPNAPLTVQIPPNLSSPSPLPVHPLQQVNGSVQPFINTNFPPPFANHQQANFQNGNVRPRFY